MAEKVYLPRLGQTMTEGKILEWLKKDTENVHKGDELYTLEYDKATINVESTADGTLRVLVSEDETVPVGTVVGLILGENEEAVIPKAKEEKSTKTEEPESRVIAGAKIVGARISISPLARKLAEEYGIDVSKVKASDPSGRISREDILCFRAQQQNGIKKVPLSGIRKVIAKRMTESAFTAPVVTYSSDVDMSALSRLRDRLNEKLAADNIKISFTDLIVKAAAAALSESPHINVQLEDENICYMPDINIGIAVAAEKGLVVPVVKNADKLSIEELSKAVKTLAEHARSGGLKQDEISGGTFTVSNLGMYGIDMFTPIINQPESAILGTGRITDKAVVIEKSIEIRPMMVLSLTADHRVIDGAPASQFLSTVKKYIEFPENLLK